MVRGESRPNGADPPMKDSKATIWFSTGLLGATCSACRVGQWGAPLFGGTSGRVLVLIRSPDGDNTLIRAEEEPLQQAARLPEGPSWSEHLCVIEMIH